MIANMDFDLYSVFLTVTKHGEDEENMGKNNAILQCFYPWETKHRFFYTGKAVPQTHEVLDFFETMIKEKQIQTRRCLRVQISKHKILAEQHSQLKFDKCRMEYVISILGDGVMTGGALRLHKIHEGNIIQGDFFPDAKKHFDLHIPTTL